MAEVRQHNRDRSMQRQLQTKKCRDYGTQMEEKGTRTIGTMSEPIKTRNAGNEVQPQSSSTQTLTRLQDHQEDELDYHRPQRKTNLRSSSQSPQRDDYSDYDHHPRSKSHRSHLSSSKDPHHTPPPPVEYRTPSPSNHHRHASRSQRSRSPSSSSQRRSRQTQRSPSPSLSRYYLKSSSHLPRTSSPPVQYRSTSHHSRDRPQMVSTETDTSLDGMKFTKNRGVQPDPLPSTRDYGVSTSTEKVYPTETNQSPKISQSQYQPLYPTVTKREDFGLTSPNQSKRRSVRNDEPLSTSKSYRLRPQSNDSFVNNYERLPGKEDDTLSHADNRSQPRTSIIAPLSDDEEDDRRQSRLSYPNDEVIKQLARGDSISIPSTTVVQPDTLPRSFTQHQQPNSYDNRKKPTQTPIHHGRSQRTPPKDDSVAYHIGTQNILHQSPTNEFATPFKVRYVEDANNDFSLNNNQIRSSTLKREDLRARSQQIILLPVINSARTYVFEKQSIPAHRMRQSRTNRNFYLAKSPTLRSLNSSFHIDESEIDPLTQIIESDNLNGHTLRSEVA